MTLARGGPDSGDFLERVRFFFEHRLPHRPDYEQRPEQLQMALAVAQALQGEELLVVEAGTGTGKSLAYLIPSLLWAFDRRQPVVISTRTLNLQQQLLEKDIPLLRELMDQPFRATPARGWSNYVCLRRLESVQNSQQATPELSHEATSLAENLSLGAPGVRQQLQVSDPLWTVIQAESAACNRQLCPYFQDCYLFRERREMERSELIIANHSLVMADLALRRDGAPGILPRPECWILDEGHHLEEVANEHLGRSLSLADLNRLRQSVYEPKGKVNDAGWLPTLRDRLAKAPVPSDSRARMLELLDRGLLTSLPTFYQVGEEFFHWLAQAILALGVEGRIPINSDFFYTPEGSQCRQVSEQWAAHLSSLEGSVRSLHQAVTENELEATQGGLAELQSLMDRLKGLRNDLEFCLFPDSQDWVYWAQNSAHDTQLGATPLDVGEHLASDFFGPARSVVVTSATLAVGKDLSYFEQRVGLDQHTHRIQRACLDSPFDFMQSAYLGVATDLPDPNKNGFWTQSREALSWLVQQLQGRTFLLTTSHASLRLAKEALQAPLAQAGIRLLAQGQAPAGMLLDQFRRDSRALLIGADSFWEGVDVPGDDLSCVILTRLPFRVPNDPLVKAHCRRLEEEGLNSFANYQMPQAILKFRQGFGRLIRTQRDRGLVLVLDSRLYHKSYGSDFMGALPRCQRRAGRLAGLVQDAMKWLRKE
ncbi:hypothetical protein IV102_10055 [bacterium]|nr:hypothetical protein [bacterium]